MNKVVGAPYDNDGGQSQWRSLHSILKFRRYCKRSSQKISSTEGNFRQNLQVPDVFGFSSSSLTDLNGDGITDIAVGSPHRYYYNEDLSPLHILFLDKDGTVKSFEYYISRK